METYAYAYKKCSISNAYDKKEKHILVRHELKLKTELVFRMLQNKKTAVVDDDGRLPTYLKPNRVNESRNYASTKCRRCPSVS